MGLLDYAEEAKNKLRGLLGDMPISHLVRGDYEMPTMNGLRNALLGMPKPFNPNDASANEAAMAFWNPAGLLGKIVYHGSPHSFNKFDASKIGTGEGAQAYGHGVYLADDAGVAGSYKKPGFDNFDVRRVDGGHEVTIAGGKRIKFKTLDEADKYLNEYGSLYKADLPDEWIPKMLDWDKPLSQQSKEVQAALSDEAAKYIARGAKVPNAGMIVKSMEYLDKETGKFGGPQGIAAKLKESGVTGIRYLDGGSRGKGQGSYNYVVFPGLEDQVKILERNGVPVNGLLGGK